MFCACIRAQSAVCGQGHGGQSACVVSFCADWFASGRGGRLFRGFTNLASVSGFAFGRLVCSGLDFPGGCEQGQRSGRSVAAVVRSPWCGRCLRGPSLRNPGSEKSVGDPPTRKKKRLLACSGVAKIDSHSPEVAVILEKFSTLPPPDLSNSDFGGFLSRWCPLPEAAAIGVLIENPSRAADVDKVLSADAALVVHAIDSKRHALEAFLFPAADASRAGWRRHVPFTWIGVVLFFFLVLLFPVSETISGPCELVPTRRASAVAQTAGRIERVLVSEGSMVTKGAPLFQIGDSKLRAQLEIMLQQQARFGAEVRLRRGEGDMQALRSAALEKDRLSSEIETIRRDIADSTIAAPLDGAVISKDLDLRLGEVVQPGTILCEVASLEDWDLQIRVDEADAGPLERAIAARKDLPVRFALQARADLILQARVTSPSEISQMVYTEAGKSFMYVTVKGINLPDELKGEIRPGFSGLAKIEGRKLPLAYNLASRAIHFLKLRFLL